MTFANRAEAAKMLVQKLVEFKGQSPLVLPIPRGAVPMGKILAEKLDGDLDVILVHKIGAPGNPEYAIGSIDESGRIELNEGEGSDATDPEIGREAQEQMKTLRKRREMYTAARLPIDVAGRIVIIVDDGIATGSTMLAAIHAVRSKSPKKIIVAAPVAARDALDRVGKEADEVVCLSTPSLFGAVAQFYEHFPQVTDEQVVEMLKS